MQQHFHERVAAIPVSIWLRPTAAVESVALFLCDDN
jgi:hypothetical protein